MPVGKPIAECLQGLGLLAQGSKPTKSQWTASAKVVYGRITGLIAAIEEEDRAGGDGKSLNERIRDRTFEWVDEYSDLWIFKNRGSLFPHAPLYPADKSISYGISYTVPTQTRNERGPRVVPDGDSYDDDQAQGVTNDCPVSSTQDSGEEQTSEVSDEASERATSPESSSHDQEATGFNQSPAPHTVPAIPAAASIFNPAPTLQASHFNAIISYRSPEPRPIQTNDPFQNPHPNSSPQNFFTSFAYPLVAFPEAMFSRVIFLVRPSKDYTRSTGRIMGLAEAQGFVNFRAGTLEKLEAIGERIGSRGLVAKLEWLPVPFLVQNSHDHYFLLKAVKAWAEWKKPNLCVVYVSLEDEA